jgi:hypothetical protein
LLDVLGPLWFIWGNCLNLGRYFGSCLRPWGALRFVFGALGDLGAHVWDPEGAFRRSMGALGLIWEVLGLILEPWAVIWSHLGGLGAHF